jgi:hypothetical protein
LSADSLSFIVAFESAQEKFEEYIPILEELKKLDIDLREEDSIAGPSGDGVEKEKGTIVGRNRR